jgi:hypothetical protein
MHVRILTSAISKKFTPSYVNNSCSTENSIQQEKSPNFGKIIHQFLNPSCSPKKPIQTSINGFLAQENEFSSRDGWERSEK